MDSFIPEVFVVEVGAGGWDQQNRLHMVLREDGYLIASPLLSARYDNAMVQIGMTQVVVTQTETSESIEIVEARAEEGVKRDEALLAKIAEACPAGYTLTHVKLKDRKSNKALQRTMARRRESFPLKGSYTTGFLRYLASEGASGDGRRYESVEWAEDELAAREENADVP